MSKTAGSLVLLAVCAARVLAQAPTQGWTFAMKTTMDSARGGPPVVMTYRIEASGSKMRNEMSIPTISAPATAGMYMIVNTADSTMTTVMPQSRMVTIMSLSSMIMRPGGRPLMSRLGSDVAKADVTDLGAGDPILGQATRRYGVVSVSQDTLGFGSQTCVRSSETSGELWIAPALDAQAVLDSLSGRMESLMGGGGAAGLSTWMSAIKKQLPKGAVLRTNLKTTTRGADGQPVTINSSMELTEVKQGPIAPGEFSAPLDYQTMDMRDMMDMVSPDMMNSAMNPVIATMMRGMCTGRKP